MTLSRSMGREVTSAQGCFTSSTDEPTPTVASATRLPEVIGPQYVADCSRPLVANLSDGREATMAYGRDEA